MAQITIVIDTQNADANDRAILQAVSGANSAGNIRGATAEQAHALDAAGYGEYLQEQSEAQKPNPQPEAAPKTRGRPKKAAEPTPEPQQSGTQDQTDAGDPSADLEAALLEGEEAAQVTAQDVMQAMHKHIEKHGAPNTLPLLQQHANGAASFKQIEPAYYAAVHAALTAGL